jgi:hypothetical protein
MTRDPDITALDGAQLLKENHSIWLSERVWAVHLK